MSDFNRRQYQSLYDAVASVTATVDPASLADGAGATATVTCTGVALGDIIEWGAGVSLAGVTCTVYPTANTINIRIQNESGGGVNLASSTWNFIVKRPAAAAQQAAS